MAVGGGSVRACVCVCVAGRGGDFNKLVTIFRDTSSQDKSEKEKLFTLRLFPLNGSAPSLLPVWRPTSPPNTQYPALRLLLSQRAGVTSLPHYPGRRRTCVHLRVSGRAGEDRSHCSPTFLHKDFNLLT